MIEQFVRERFFNPWSNFGRLQNDFGRFLQERHFPSEGLPALSVYENSEKVLVRADLPGIQVEKIEITTQDNTLTVKGERILPELKENATLLRQERSAGEFSRTLTLPFRIDSEKIKAVYAQGVLEVEIQRPEEVKPKKINIKIN